jgi:hypothetical protein
MTLINPHKSASRLRRWRETLSMCRWILITSWAGRSCAIAVMNPTGPMVVVQLRALADLRSLTKELEDTSYELEIRFQGHSP